MNTDKLLALADEIRLAAGHAEVFGSRDISTVLVTDWAARLRALAQPAEAVEGGWPAIYGMFRAIVEAGGPETIARHGVERGSDQWVSKVRAGMLAIEWRHHPERFDEPPFTDAAQGAVAGENPCPFCMGTGACMDCEYNPGLCDTHDAATAAGLYVVEWIDHDEKRREVAWDEEEVSFYISSLPDDAAKTVRVTRYTHPQAAPAQGDGFYIASFKGERPGHPVMWWAPDNRGYTTDLEQAGVYAHPAPGYHDDEYNVPVPAVFVQGRRIRREIDPGDSENTMFWSAETLRAALAAAPSPEPRS